MLLQPDLAVLGVRYYQSIHYYRPVLVVLVVLYYQ
jgi:hypothetical protein